VASLFVGTRSGLNTFGEEGRPEGVQLPEEDVTAIAPDGESWWAVTGGQELWRGDGSGGWQRVARLQDLRANCLCPSPAGLFVGTSEAHLMLLRDGQLEQVDVFEKTQGRQEWYTPWGGPPDVRSMSRGPDDVLYANVHVGGIVRSADEGGSWEPTVDIHADIHQVLAPDHRGMVVAACARGLARSDDGGDSWAFETEGLHAPYSRAVAVGNGTLYLSASQGPRGGKAALYRKPIDGEPFEKCSEGLPEWFGSNIDSGCVVAGGGRVAFGTDEGVVFASRDSGRTWESWAADLPSVRCLAWRD
jgi:hypothetical protein